MIDALKVLVVEDNSDYACLVQRWLSSPADGINFDLAWTDSLGAATERLARGGIDIVFLDLGLPDSDGLPTFTGIREPDPTLPVIVLSTAENEAIALQAIQQGAQDYLAKSTCTGEFLIRAVRYAHLRNLSSMSRTTHVQSANATRIVGLLGAKGGVGVTTIACILADELCAQTGGRVLLADPDSNNGSVAFQIGRASCRERAE